MIQQIYDSRVLIYAMLGLCALGILVKIIISCVYNSIIKASDHMGTTNNKMLKTIRMKFETNYSINVGVNNVDIFVDKYVYTHKFCGIHLYTWENFSGQLLLLCMLTGAVGALLGLLYECGKTPILLTLFFGVLTSSMLILFEHFINLSTKKNILRINIKDYLENYLAGKLRFNQIRQQQMQESKNKEEQEAPIKREKSSLSQKQLEKMYELDKSEDKIIQDILKEYII